MLDRPGRASNKPGAAPEKVAHARLAGRTLLAMADNLTPSVEELREILATSDCVDGGDVDLDEEEIYLVDGTRLTEARAEQMAEEIYAEHRGA